MKRRKHFNMICLRRFFLDVLPTGFVNYILYHFTLSPFNVEPPLYRYLDNGIYEKSNSCELLSGSR